MPLLALLMRRLGYAKLDQFGLELAANDRVVSRHRRAQAVAGDWVVGWRDSDELIEHMPPSSNSIRFDEATARPRARASTAPLYFPVGSAATDNMPPKMQATKRPITVEDADGVVQTEAQIVMQSEPVDLDAGETTAPDAGALAIDPGSTLNQAPTTAQRRAAMPEPKTIQRAAVEAPAANANIVDAAPAMAVAAASHGSNDANNDDDEWEWMMARARAEQPSSASPTAAPLAATTDEEAAEWQAAMERARTAVVIAAPPPTADIEIPIVIATPVQAMPAVAAPPIAPAPAPAVSVVRRATTQGSGPLGLPPHLQGSAPALGGSPLPLGLQGHTARIYVGAIPTMPSGDNTRHTRPTMPLPASSNKHEPDNDPVIPPPRPGTISPASRLARPLPPLPTRATTIGRPALIDAPAPLRPVPRITRRAPTESSRLGIGAAPRTTGSHASATPIAVRRLATAS